MKKNIIILLGFFVLFWAVFLLLQNSSIYENTLGFVADNWVSRDGQKVLVHESYQTLTNDNYVQWDGKLYQIIRNHGYNIEKSNGDYIFAFFPLFPLIWRISHLPPIGVIFLNFILFSIGVLLLLKIFKQHNNQVTSLNTLLILTLPGMVIYLMPYTEATFMLTTAIGFYGLVRKKYGLFFLGFFLSALTRPSYTILFLSIIGTEFFLLLAHRNLITAFKNVFTRSLPLVLGTILVSFVQSLRDGGSWFKFIEVQKYWNHVLSIPENLGDWSHESFGINVAMIFLVCIPVFVFLIQNLFIQLRNHPTNKKHYADNPMDYLVILSCFYITGSFLFVLLYQGGSLNGLFRYTLCTPFFLVLILRLFESIQNTPFTTRVFILANLAISGLFVLFLDDYSIPRNFSDTGHFVLLLAIILWTFQDLYKSWVYKASLYLTLLLNVVWTTYLFNTYIANGWIFT